MPCHPIYDFVLSITTSNVVWWDKNAKTTRKEVTLTILIRGYWNLSDHLFKFSFGEDFMNEDHSNLELLYRRRNGSFFR